MKALIFSASGIFARFRCPYTTTSALTYTLIHPIAVKGLIGAIMGVDYSELFQYSTNMRIGIEVQNPIKKDTQSFNLVPQAKNNGSPTFPSRIEFLRDVSYRIYLIDEEEKLLDIKKVLLERSYIFTPYLGASEHIAKLDFEKITEVNEAKGTVGVTKSVVPKSEIILENISDIQLYLDRIPVENEKTREYIKYEKVAFATGKTIKVKLDKLLKVGEDHVYFF